MPVSGNVIHMDISSENLLTGNPAAFSREQDSPGDSIYSGSAYSLLVDEKSNSISVPIQFLESLPLPLFVKDLNGTYIACNSYFSSMIGYPPDEIIGKNVTNLVDSDTAAIHISADEKLIRSGTRIIYETTFATAEDAGEPIRIIKTPLIDNHGTLNGIIGLVSKINPFQSTEKPAAETSKDSQARLRQRSVELEERNSKLVEKIAGQLRVENEMLQFENRLEIALKALNAGAWEWNPHSEVLLWSDKCYEIFGLEKGPVSMQSWMARIYPDDLERVKEMWSRITLQAGWFDLEFRILVSGQLHWIRKSGYYLPANDKGFEKVTGVMADISDEKDFSNKLYQSQQFFKAIIEDQTELICRTRPDGSFTFVNQAFARFFSETSDNLLHKSLSDLISPRDFSKIGKLQQRIKPSKSLAHFEQRITRSDQTKAVLHWTIRAIYMNSGIPDEYQFVGRDVTEIEASREALRKSEEMFRLITENSNDIISIHPEDGTIAYVSPSVKYLLGYKPEELIGSKAEEIVCTEDLEILHNCSLNLQVGDKPALMTLRLKDKQGNLIWFESMIQRQRNSQGEATGNAIAVSRNIQSRKLVEEQQKLTEQQLKEANLTKDKFFSIIAHDLRSPFTSILGFTRLLNDEYNDFSEDERKMMVKQVQNSTESTFQLLDNLLAWAKTQLGRSIFNPETFTVESLIKESVKQTTPQAQIKDIKISPGRIADISLFADQNMIRTVLRNLLSNAIKFSFPGGTIELDSYVENKLLTISVTDHGTGMPPEVLQKLFSLTEQATSTKGTANEKGTGLGLILCREFVERNGGTIRVESEVGKGSTFSIALPVIASPAN